MNLTSPKIIKELLARHGFSFTKSLGQNFLINPSVCPRIALSAENLGVIEIGAGVGVLTRELSRVAEKVVVIEIDQTLKPILEETLADCPNVEFVWGDVLKTDLRSLIAEKFDVGCDAPSAPQNENAPRIAVCANLPYYITSPVIMRLLEERLPLESVTVMVQKEAAERLCAAPGTRNCGAVSVAVRYYSEPKKLFDVSRNSFMPAPNVDSAVIRLDIRPLTSPEFSGNHTGSPLHLIEDEAFFFRIVRAAFSQRRKQLINPVSAELGLAKEDVRSALEACGLKPTARAEELTLDDYIKFYNGLRGKT